MDAVPLAAEIDDPDPDTGLPAPAPREWTERERRVARDARKPLKQAPGYLAMCQRIHESYVRADAHREQEPGALNVTVMNLTVNQVAYPVKELK